MTYRPIHGFVTNFLHYIVDLTYDWKRAYDSKKNQDDDCAPGWWPDDPDTDLKGSLSNIAKAGWLGGLQVNIARHDTVVTSDTVADLARDISWYRYHWQKDQLEAIFASADPLSGNDEITGGKGDDVIFASGGNDRIYAGNGDDYVDGGAGRDDVYGGQGADIGIFADVNSHGYDLYDGGTGRGRDTLVLRLTLDEYNAAKHELARFQTHLDKGLDNWTFKLKTLGLKAVNWEQFVVEVAPVFDGNDTGTVSELANETGSDIALTASGSLAFGDDDLTGGHSVSVTLASARFVADGAPVEEALAQALQDALTVAIADGPCGDGRGSVDWNFALQDSLVDFLDDGEAITIVYDVTVDDGLLTDTAQVTITVNGSSDSEPPVAVDDNLATDEIALNDVTAGDQNFPVLALEDGNVVAVWWSRESGLRSVKARILDEDGNETVSEFQVNNVPTSIGAYPSVDDHLSVSALAGGGFVVTWISRQGGNLSTEARVFSGDGTPVGNQFNIAPSASAAIEPAITGLDDGGFAVAWSAVEGGVRVVKTQIFDADRDARSGVVDVGPVAANERQPAISSMGGDGFVVLWENANGIFGEIFDASGVVTTVAFQIRDGVVNTGEWPSVDLLADGNIIAAWTSGGFVQTRIFDDEGNPTGPVLTVTADGYRPDVAVLTNGNFLVTWQTGEADSDIKARLFTADGDVIGRELTINTGVEGAQTSPSVVALPDGGFAIAWQSDSAGPQDDFGDGVRIRYFDEQGTPLPSGAFADDGVTVIDTAQLLANDSDPDNDMLTVVAVGDSDAGAVVTLNGDGTISYDPNGRFDYLADGDYATDTFDYTIDDGFGNASTASVTVVIKGSSSESVSAAGGSAGTFMTEAMLIDDTDASMTDGYGLDFSGQKSFAFDGPADPAAVIGAHIVSAEMAPLSTEMFAHGESESMAVFLHDGEVVPSFASGFEAEMPVDPLLVGVEADLIDTAMLVAAMQAEADIA